MAKRNSFTLETIIGLYIHSSQVCKLLARYQEAWDRLEKAKHLADAIGSDKLSNHVLSEQAALCYRQGRLDEGLALARKVIDAEESSDGEFRASAWNTMGNIHLRRCDFEKAEQALRQALDYFLAAGMKISVAIVRNNLANIHNVRGEQCRAMELYNLALKTFERHGDDFRTAHVLYHLSQIHQIQGEHMQARACLRRSLELRQRMQDYRGIANCLLTLISNETESGDFPNAIQHLQQVDEIITDPGITDPHIEVSRQGTAGILHFHMGEFEEAEKCFLRLIEISRHNGFSEFLCGGHHWLGKNRVYRDRTRDGLEDIHRGLELAVTNKLPHQQLEGWSFLAECCRMLGDREGAARAFEKYKKTALGQGLSLDEIERVARELAGD